MRKGDLLSLSVACFSSPCSFVSSTQRLLVFQHGELECGAEYKCPQGVHNTFSYMFETPTDLNGTEELLDFETSCTVQRGSNTSDFFILNQYANGAAGKADAESAAVENSVPNIRRRLTACRNKFGRDPSLLVVNFWNLGGAVEMARRRNFWLAQNSGSDRQ